MNNPFYSETATYKPETIRALREFKALKTWKPENASGRAQGMVDFMNKMAGVYGVNVEFRLVEDSDQELPTTNEARCTCHWFHQFRKVEHHHCAAQLRRNPIRLHKCPVWFHF